MDDTKSGTSDRHEDEIRSVELRNPATAALLTWLLPGLGQWYQGRTSKAILYFVCIFGTFLYGCYLGSDSEHGPARVVYYSMRDGDQRYYFFPQACIGTAAIPAILQSGRVQSGKPPLFGGCMAPPSIGGQGFGPSLDEMLEKSPDFYALGTDLTVIAGLLNLLAIFDAFEGPVFIGRRREIAETEDEAPAGA